jgi:hypothetical protein
MNMSKLWVLKPRDGRLSDPWSPWYDNAFGFVVRAVDEESARKFANKNAGDENRHSKPWLDSELSTCEELTPEGNDGVILRDFASA